MTRICYWRRCQYRYMPGTPGRWLANASAPPASQNTSIINSDEMESLNFEVGEEIFKRPRKKRWYQEGFCA